MKTHAILVLGMHRSGTSTVTRVMSLLGASLPKTLLGQNSGNTRGHWESQVIIDHHDAVLKQADSDWKDWRPLDLTRLGSLAHKAVIDDMAAIYKREFGDAALSVVKEPRICRFVDSYLAALAQAGCDVSVILPLRNPMEVARSLESRDGIDIHDGLMMWLSYTLQAEKATRALPRSFCSYDSFLNNPVEDTQRIVTELSLNTPYSVTETAPQITEFVSPGLKRQAISLDALTMDSRSRTWVADAYQALLVLCENKNNKAALATLDSISESFYPAVEPLYAAVKDASDLRARTTHLDATLLSERESHAQAWQDAEEKNRRIQDEIWEKANDAIKQASVTAAEFEDARTQATEVEDLKQVIAEQAKGLTESTAEIKQLKSIVAKQTKGLAEYAAEVERLGNMHAQQTKGLSEYAAEIERLKTTLAQQTKGLAEYAAEVERLKTVAKDELEALKAKTQDEMDAQLRKNAVTTEYIAATARAEATAARDDIRKIRARHAKDIADIESRTEAEINFMRDEFAKILQDTESERDEARRALDHARTEQDMLHGRIKAYQAEIEMILSSTSWRVTSGLRAVLNRLRGQSATPRRIKDETVKKRLTYDGDDVAQLPE